MKSLNSKIINFRLCSSLISVLFMAIGLFGVNEAAWGGDVTLKATAESYPSAWGYVYVSKSNSAPSSYSLTSDYADETKYSAYVFGYLTVSQDFYLFAGPKDGYAFKYWSKSSSATSGDSANPKKVTVSGKKSGTVTDGPYYAIFEAVTVNSVSSNPISSSDKALKLTEPGNKIADIKFSVSHADAKADFDEPTISGAGWSIVSWSLSGTTVTVKVKYTATNTTSQGDHTGTVTLTSKGTSGSQSKSATVYANVDFTPTISASPTSYDFGMFTIGVDSKMSKEFALTVNANAVIFSNDASYPFSAFIASDKSKIVVYFEPTAVDAGSWNSTITVTAKNNQNPKLSATQTITVSGQAQAKTYPTYTCNIQNTYMVDDVAIDLQTLWTSTSNGAIEYSIDSYTEHGSNNTAGTKPAITNNRYLSLGRACEIKLKLTQAGATNYFADSDTKTITINKYETSFSGSNYNLMVDGTQTADYVYTNVSAAQPTASSSDNFYYTIDNVSFTNSTTNNGTNLVTFNPSNKLITACNAGTAKITLHQNETYKYTGATKSFDVAVYKYNSAFANAANLPVKVDAEVQSNYTLTYSKPNSAYIGDVPVAGNPSLNTGDYYYTLTQNVTSDNTTGSPDATIAAAYNAGTRKAIGKNAGTCTVNLYQKENYKFNAAQTSFVVTVTKNDPTFTWKAGPYYHNTTVENIFSSSNTDFAYTIGTSTDAQVAYVSGSNLIILSKNGSAQFTVAQGANYKWSGKSATYTVTPENPSNHVTFTYTQAMYNDGSITTAKTSATGTEWTSSGVRLGGSNTALLCSESTNWDDKYIDIKFFGIPEKVTFNIAVNSNRTTGDYWYVKESTDGSTWSEEKWHSEHNGTSFSSTQTVNLSSTTRYIRLCYSGNYAGYFKNVKVTELKKFTPNPTELDFGTLDINTTGAATQKTFEFNYANVGHNVTLSTNDDHFTVSPTTITSIGGEKAGTYTPITVTYSTAEEHKATNAKVTITDELGNSASVTLKGETKKLTPTINWSPDASIFNVEDVLSAANANNLTVTLSVASADEAYVACSGNTATMIDTKSGTVTVTAHVTGNAIYEDADFTKDITITNKIKQSISWDNGNFSRLKTTDANKTITLDATASSGLPVSYKLEGDATGLTLTKNNQTGVWTLTYSASECKNTTIVAMQEGNETYAPAPNFSLPVKVIDPTKECDVNYVVINSDVVLKSASDIRNIDIPDEMTIEVKRTNTEWYAANLYSNGFDVEFYSGTNGGGNQIGSTYSYSASDINPSKTITIKPLDRNIKSVKLISEALFGYTVTNVTYKQQKYCEIDKNTLNFETYPNTTTSAQTFTVNYANYPISLECANSKFTISPKDFGDCGEKGTETISVTYTAGAAEGTDNGNILYIKDNTGVTLGTCTLNVSISKVAQSIISTNITTPYKTTDKVALTAKTNSGLSNFTYSATPAGIASFDGNEMTFSQSGTIAITVSEPGSNVYRPCSTTVANVVVDKVTPTLTLPTGTNVTYLQNLSASTLSGGKATVTLRGVADTEVGGSFAWTNAFSIVNGAAGNNSYEVTFYPTDNGMYNPATGLVTVTVEKANQAIVMNNGTVSVAVDKGLDANSADSKLDLTTLIASQTTDALDANRTGAVTYEVIGDNSANATISGTIFYAIAEGVYTIRAIKAATNYYNVATTEFTVTASVRANSLNLNVVGACTKYVDQEVNDVLANINSDGEIHTSSTAATIAYYDIEHNKIVIPNSEAKSFNDTTVTIKIWQDGNVRFAASGEMTIEVTVKKYDNTIDNSLDGDKWFRHLNFDQQIHIKFNTDNTDYTHSPIVITQDEKTAKIATYKEDKDSIYASHFLGTTSWTLIQAESYKYKGDTAVLFVEVGTVESGGCDLLEEIVFENDTKASEIHIPLAEIGTAGTLYFKMKSNGAVFGAAGNDALLYKMVDNVWYVDTISVSGLSGAISDNYYSHEPIPLDPNTSAIRFARFAKFGLVSNITFDDPYINNIRISRKEWIRAEDVAKNPITAITIPTNTASRDGNTKTAKFYVNYSTCDDKIYVNSNDSRIKVTPEVFDVEHIGRKEITVSYTSKTVEKGSTTIDIISHYETTTITVYFETVKEDQVLIWQEGYIGDPITLQVNLSTDSAAIASSHKPVTYTSGDESVIKVAKNGYSFQVIAQSEDPVKLTAHAEGDSRWNPVTESKWVMTSDLATQVIIWDQDFMSLYKGDQELLEAIAKIFDLEHPGGIVSEERTNQITYSVPAGDTIISIVDGQLHAIGTGATTITASLAGVADMYAAATSVTLPVYVYAVPTGICEPSLIYSNSNPMEFYVFDMTYPEVVNYVHLNHTKTSGDPDILTFSVFSQEYKPKVGNLEVSLQILELLNIHTYMASEIKVYVSKDNGEAWSEEPLAVVTPAKDQTIPSGNILLDADVTDLKFVRPQGGAGKHFVQDLKVTCLPALKCEYDSINGMPELNLGHVTAAASRSDYITFSYFNVKGDLRVEQTLGSNPGNVLMLGENIIPLSCGATGTYQLPITFHPMEVGLWADTVTITEPLSGLTLNIRVTAEVTKATQDIIWEGQPLELDMPEVPELCYPYVWATSGLPVQFEILEGNDIASIVDGKVVVTDPGTVTIKATQPGNENFLPADPVTKTFTIGLYIFRGTAGDPSLRELWCIDENWNTGKVPTIEHSVRIESDLKITVDAAAYSFEIRDGVNVTIMPIGGLTVGKGGIVGATTENLILKADSCSTSPTKGQTGYLRISPECTREMPNAKVELFSIAYYDYDDKSGDIAKWQYVGSPLASTTELAKTVYKHNWVYAWDEETEEWFNQRATYKLTPFAGFATTQRTYANGILLTYAGQLVSSNTKVDVPLVWSGAGKGINVVANSFVAPIDITKFEDDDFANVDKVIYIFNTGSKRDEEAAAPKAESYDAPGQYIAIPVGSARLLKAEFGLPTTIAPMQGFCVQATGSDAHITMDYEKLVWGGNYVENKPAPLHSPKRANAAVNGSLRISLAANGWIDHLFMIESEQFDAEYENGYDAHKRMGDELNIFAVEDEAQLSVDATNSILGTRIGVRTGEETEYIISFSHLNSENPLALLDMETEQITEITEWTEYSFSAAPNTVITDRFMIIEGDGSHMPTITTDVDEVESDVKVFKFIKDNQLFILKNGVLYNASGILVRK